MGRIHVAEIGIIADDRNLAAAGNIDTGKMLEMIQMQNVLLQCAGKQSAPSTDPNPGPATA